MGRGNLKGKSDKSGKGEGHVVYVGVSCVCIMCGSAHSCGGVVNCYYYCTFYHVYCFCVYMIEMYTTCCNRAFLWRSSECPANGRGVSRRGSRVPHPHHEPVPLPGRGGTEERGKEGTNQDHRRPAENLTQLYLVSVILCRITQLCRS